MDVFLRIFVDKIMGSQKVQSIINNNNVIARCISDPITENLSTEKFKEYVYKD